MKYMASYYDWLKNQEFAYIINLDTDMLEVYYLNELKYTFRFDSALEEMRKLGRK